MAGVCGLINGGRAQGRGAPVPDDPAAVVPVEVVEQVTAGGHGQGTEGGVGNDGLEALEATREVAERTAGELPRMLAFGGTTVTSLAFAGCFAPPKHLAAHKFLPAAYYMALFLLFCFGLALIVMSVWVSGDPPRRAAASKTVMWATLAPLLLVLLLGTLGMD